jgi:hypothetical protein
MKGMKVMITLMESMAITSMLKVMPKMLARRQKGLNPKQKVQNQRLRELRVQARPRRKPLLNRLRRLLNLS